MRLGSDGAVVEHLPEGYGLRDRQGVRQGGERTIDVVERRSSVRGLRAADARGGEPVTVTEERAELDAVLDQNARNLRDDLTRRIRELEARYEIASDRLEEELAAGRLSDTAEVSRWVLLWRTLRSLNPKTNGRGPARLG